MLDRGDAVKQSARAGLTDGRRTRASASVERLEVLDQIALLDVIQRQIEDAVVVVDDVQQRLEAAVVIEAGFLHRFQAGRAAGVVVVGPEATERGCAIPAVRCTMRLEGIDADFLPLVEIPPRFGPERFDMAVVASGLAAEQSVAARGRAGVERPGRRLWCVDRQLVEM